MIKIDNTTYKEETDEVTIVFGDDKQKEFMPQYKVEKWENKVNFSIRYTLSGKPVFKKVGQKLEAVYSDATLNIEHNDRSNKAGQDRCNTSNSYLRVKPTPDIR